jgi:hypothetical protein
MKMIKNKLLGLCGKYAISSGHAGVFGDKKNQRIDAIKLAIVMRVLKILYPND